LRLGVKQGLEGQLNSVSPSDSSASEDKEKTEEPNALRDRKERFEQCVTKLFEFAFVS